MRVRTLLALLALGMTLVVSGCDMLFEPTPGSMISGFVVNSGSGEPVRGTRVTVTGMSTGFADSTVTNLQGHFQIRVAPDFYEINLAKEGYAGSRVIGLDARGPAEIEIIQRVAIDPRLPLTTPEIILEGVEDGDVLEGEVPYRVDTAGPNDIRSIYVAIGKTPGSSFITAPRHFFSESPSTGDQVTSPALFGAVGQTTFEVVVYDMNDNRAHQILYVSVAPPGGELTPASELTALAITLGKQIQFYGVSGAAAPTSANVYVELNWSPSQNATITGYNIYRSYNGASFELAASVAGDQTFYKDYDPGLFPGRPVFYYVTAARGADESTSTAVVQSVPLPTWDVRLLEPSDELQDVNLTPTFSWEPTRQVSPYHFYAAAFRDTVTGDNEIWLTPEPPEFLLNETEYTWNEDGQYDGTPYETLQPYRLYEWEVVYAVAVDDPEDPTAISVATNRYGINDDRFPIQQIGIGATDNFQFTTGER